MSGLERHVAFKEQAAVGGRVAALDIERHAQLVLARDQVTRLDDLDAVSRLPVGISRSVCPFRP